MSDPQIFKAALDFVHEALEARALAGHAVKAPASKLEQLCSVAHEKQGVFRNDVLQQSPETVLKDLPSQANVESVAGDHFAAVAPPAATRKREDVAPFPLLPNFADELSAQERLEALSRKAHACVLCPQLAETRKTVVFGEGSSAAELMFVCEAPGIDEDRAGLPFAGEARQLLDKMLTAMGLGRDEVYLTSALKCRPNVADDPSASRPAAKEELQHCSPYLAAQIAIIKPKAIVAMGAEAMRALFGSTDTAGKLRSNWYNLQGIPVMPTFHPRYLIRNQSNSHKRKVWEDLLQVLDRLGRPVSDKQRGYFKPRIEG